MRLECPVCGNATSVNPRRDVGRCIYCRREYTIVKSGKRVVELREEGGMPSELPEQAETNSECQVSVL